MNRKINNLVKAALKTAVCLMEQSEGVAESARERMADGIDRASDQVSALRDRAKEQFYPREHSPARKIALFAVGAGLGLGAAILFAPASGEETRSSIGDKVNDIGQQVRNHFSGSPASASAD
jgi:YtxH-like protein